MLDKLFRYGPAAAVIKGNHTNCAQFAQSNRLDWLFSRLGSQAASEGSGMLDVLHCILIDSPEALNMMTVSISSPFPSILVQLPTVCFRFFCDHVQFRKST